MSKTILCSISDDRSGRKGGKYEATQIKMTKIFIKNSFVDEQKPWTIDGIINSTEPEINNFYLENKTMLDNKDAAINGRLYKPYSIKHELDRLNDGDYLIYNDCSPEMWKMDEDFKIDPEIYDLNVIKRLCRKANDFLVAFVKWAPDNFDSNPLGIHIHHYFTLSDCIRIMRANENSFLCASGMICIRKTPATVELVNQWLFWNTFWKCASIGNPSIPGDESLWNERESYKLGQRSDQSVLSIVLNKLNWNFVDIVYNNISPYNFLNFCRKDHEYIFLNSNNGAKI